VLDAPSASRAERMATLRSQREARSRARRQRLLRHTIVPVLAVVAVVVGILVAVSPGGGSPTRPVARRVPPPPTTSAAVVSGVGGTTSAPAPVTRAAGSTVALTPLRTPSAAAPLRVLLVGDALAADVEAGLRADPAAARLLALTVDARPGSGLAETAPVDWLSVLAGDLLQTRAELVVVALGTDDRQPITDAGTTAMPGSPAWLGAYDRRARQLAGEATGAGARLVWIGMPPVPSAAASTANQELDGVYQDAAQATAGALYVASWPVLSTGAGAYATTLPGPTGTPVRVRTGDGVGLTAAGASLVARALVSGVDAAWRLSLPV